MSSIEHDMADSSRGVADAPIEDQDGLYARFSGEPEVNHEMADGPEKTFSAPPSVEEEKPAETAIAGAPTGRETVQTTDLEMSDSSKVEVPAPVPIEEPKAFETQESAGQSIDKGKGPTTHHEVVDNVPASSPSVARPGETVADVPQNAALSAGSGTSSDRADESALQHLNVDYSDDSDSALGDMTPQTSTMSVNSSIYNYVEENGRTYHRYKEGKYMLPNDEDEMDRLDLQHQLWLITLYDELSLSPIKNAQNVLDIGTGTGIWAIEYANRNPSAHVIGSDLSPIQPQYVPPNCQFEVDDAEDEWNYSQKFDLIHGRALVACFKEPLTVITSAFQALNPGGYLEFHDFVLPMRDIDGTLQGTNIDLWQTKTIDAAAAFGTSWKRSANYPQYFEQVGFTDIVEQHFQWPINRWPKGERMKNMGSYWGEDLSRGLEALSMAVLTRGLGMTKDAVLELTTAARKDLMDKRIHAYLPVVVVYGRKPALDLT